MALFVTLTVAVLIETVTVDVVKSVEMINLSSILKIITVVLFS
jgi:hypothetical protein